MFVKNKEVIEQAKAEAEAKKAAEKAAKAAAAKAAKEQAEAASGLPESEKTAEKEDKGE